MKKDSAAQLSAFYDIWTLKESYIKCCGGGLSIHLNSFSINMDKYDNIKAVVYSENNIYSFKRINIKPDYKMSVCSLNKNISGDIIIIKQNTLIYDYFHTNY